MDPEKALGVEKATVLTPQTLEKFARKFAKHQRIYGKTGMDPEYVDAFAFLETRYPQLAKRLRKSETQIYTNPYHLLNPSNKTNYSRRHEALYLKRDPSSSREALRQLSHGAGAFEYATSGPTEKLATRERFDFDAPVTLRHSTIADKAWQKFQKLRAEAAIAQQPRDTGLVIDTTAEKIMDPRAKALLLGKKSIFNMTGKMTAEDRHDFGKIVMKGIAEAPMKDEARINYATRAINALQTSQPDTFESAFKTLHSSNLPSVAQGSVKRVFAQELQRRLPGIANIRYGASIRPLFGPRHGKGQTPFAIIPEKGPFDK